MTDHLTEYELSLLLLDVLPGGPAARAHLAACAPCQARWSALQRREQALQRLGREARTVTYGGAAAGWTRVRAQVRAQRHGFSAPALRPLAWSMAMLAVLLVFGLALPLTLDSPAWHRPVPDVALAPDWAYIPRSTATASNASTSSPAHAATVSVARTAGTLPGESNALSSLTPQPVPPAPVRTNADVAVQP